MLVAEDEAVALQEGRGDLFFTTSVENRAPLYTGHYPGTRTLSGSATGRIVPSTLTLRFMCAFESTRTNTKPVVQRMRFCSCFGKDLSTSEAETRP